MTCSVVPKLGGNFLVLVALNDERDDAQFLGRQAVADSQSDHIVFGQFTGHGHILHPVFATRDFAHAIDERWAGDIAIHDAMGACCHVALRALAGIGEDDNAGFILVGRRRGRS